MIRAGLIVLIIVLVFGGTIGHVHAQTPTPPPSPTATGTLVDFPVFPTMGASTPFSTVIWATPTAQPLGSAYIPPTAPVAITIPEIGQMNGFGAIGPSNLRQYMIWLATVAVSFYGWMDNATGESFQISQMVIGVIVLLVVIIWKIQKYQEKQSSSTWVEGHWRNKRAAKMIALIPLLLFPALPGDMQGCQQGSQCEGIPWSVPQLPALSSPSPFPTTGITAVFTPTRTPTPLPGTSTAPPTPTAGIDTGDISEQLSTLQALANATPIQMGGNVAPQNVSGNVARIYGYVRGMEQVNFGMFTPLLQLAFFAFFSFGGVYLFFLVAPFLASMIGLIRRVIQTLLDFLPF